jgi:hypothetical protein
MVPARDIVAAASVESSIESDLSLDFFDSGAVAVDLIGSLMAINSPSRAVVSSSSWTPRLFASSKVALRMTSNRSSEGAYSCICGT